MSAIVSAWNTVRAWISTHGDALKFLGAGLSGLFSIIYFAIPYLKSGDYTRDFVFNFTPEQHRVLGLVCDGNDSFQKLDILPVNSEDSAIKSNIGEDVLGYDKKKRGVVLYIFNGAGIDVRPPHPSVDVTIRMTCHITW